MEVIAKVEKLPRPLIPYAIIARDIWVDSELLENRADILYCALTLEENRRIYILFEPKSCLDKKAPLQILRYMDKIWLEIEHQQMS